MRPSRLLPPLAAAMLLTLAIYPTQADAGIFGKKNKKVEASANEPEKTKEQKDSANFKKELKDAREFKGMMDAYLKKDGTLFLAVPDDVFNHSYILSSRVNGISETGDLVAGQMNITPLVIRFSKDHNNVYMHIMQDKGVVNDNDPIKSSFNKNFIDPIVKSFKIKCKEEGKSFIDVTSFFKGNEALITPIKELDPISVMLSGRRGVDGTHYDDASSITAVKCFPGNIMIESRLSYTTKKAHSPYTVSVARHIVQLPDEPMKPRLQDNRVGYFSDNKELFSSDLDGSKTYQIINRFRVEPKEEDLEAYYSGTLVEPKQKIIFYVDSAFPEKWKPAVKEGIEYWNKGFEAAGFKNVVEARDYPKDDPDFDADDIRKNCVRYCVTPIANAMGPSHVDPRTGEILGGDVIWYHNVVQLVHDWRFAQTGAVDPRVRQKVFADSVMYESLTYVTAHEVGHVLGLMHNMGASYAFTINNLRDPQFTQKYGTTPSIMDYARNNFVAQPGDLERGVRLTPPPIGVYDIHAINWGYRLIPDAEDMFAELPTLNKWIREHDGDPMYEFGAQQMFGLIDPTDQTEDLSNDHIAAGDLAISNLKIIMANFEDWAGEPDEPYEKLYKTYKSVVNQYGRHISHVIPYIGGLRYKEVRQGAGDGPARNYLSKADQKKAMLWLMNQVRTCGWLEAPALMANFEEPDNWRGKVENSVIGCFTSPVVLGRIKKGYSSDPANCYKPEDFIDDAMSSVFEASYKGRPLDDTERNLQITAIAALAKTSGLEQLSGIKVSDKSLDAEAEFMNFMAVNSAPAIACSHDVCQHLDGDGFDIRSLDPDATRSFFRLAIGDSPLPDAELRPMMTRQLKKIRNLYNRCAGSVSDVKSKEFYSYYIKVIDKLLSAGL